MHEKYSDGGRLCFRGGQKATFMGTLRLILVNMHLLSGALYVAILSFAGGIIATLW